MFRTPIAAGRPILVPCTLLVVISLTERWVCMLSSWSRHQSRSCCMSTASSLLASSAARDQQYRRQQGTIVCRYNRHSAGSLYWPFPMLKVFIYLSNKIYGSNFITQRSESVVAWNYQNADLRGDIPALRPSPQPKLVLYLATPGDARLSGPSWLVTYRDGIPARRRSPIPVLTGPDVG